MRGADEGFFQPSAVIGTKEDICDSNAKKRVYLHNTKTKCNFVVGGVDGTVPGFGRNDNLNKFFDL